MWGIRTLSTTAILDARLIPAHAGNTSRSFFLNSCSWTHPRARGEYQEFANKVQELWGSSPRTRGILTAEGAQPLREGLIPAHAGNTLADQHRNNHYTRFSFNLSKSIDLSGKEILLCLYNLKYDLFSNCQFHINDDKWEIKNKK